MREATGTPTALYDNGVVSIHASHAGGDVHGREVYDAQQLFQSTPPMREATTARPAPLLA